MSAIKIAVVVGSIRKDSNNRKLALALALAGLAPQGFSFEHVQIGDLPLYNQDHDGSPSEQVKLLKSHVAGAQGVLFVTPEYNRSIPGVLKNALDHGSRPYGQSAWSGKPCGVIGTSSGAAGTALAQQHLRNVLAYLDMPTLGQPEAYIQFKDGLIDDHGKITVEATQKFLQTWVDRYTAFVKLHQK